MAKFIKLSFLLLNIDQETILNWFGVDVSINDIKSSTPLSLETLKLVLEGLGQRVQNGLTVYDIETFLFFAVFLRFIFLASRYNLKTAFIIACIGLIAGCFWFKHFFVVAKFYKTFLIKGYIAPYMSKFVSSISRTPGKVRAMGQLVRPGTERVMGIRPPDTWDNPGLVISTAFSKALVKLDSETGIIYRIDPVSLLFSKIMSNLTESNQKKLISFYYLIYEEIIPGVVKLFKTLWSQLAGICAYITITRLGKRYCPYLIRWHWTCLILITCLEPVYMGLIHRIFYFNALTLAPQVKALALATPGKFGRNYELGLKFQFYFFNGALILGLLFHLGLLFWALVHALCGQYFYVPFLVPNVELHVGLRPTNSIYSQGKTPWQDKTNIQSKSSKSWYSWFGSTKIRKFRFVESLKKLTKKILNKLKRK